MKAGKKRRRVQALEWINDLSGKSARVTAIGRKTLLVENHAGILEYAQNRVLLASGCGAIEIEGSGLTLSEVRRGALMIRGSVRRVNLPCPAQDAP